MKPTKLFIADVVPVLFLFSCKKAEQGTPCYSLR